MVEDLNAGRFGTVGYKIGLADDSVRLLKTAHIPDAIWDSLMKVRQQIIDGSVPVAEVYDAEDVRALMTSVEAPGAE
jgi:simple sugar transport system substrate-binding protein